MKSDEEDLFLEEMSGVEPLNREPRVNLSSSNNAKDSSLGQRRAAAVQGNEPDRNTLSDADIPPLDSWFVLEFKRPGIQNGVYRKFKQGRYEAEARLDMHRMTVVQARLEVFGFLEECYELGLRSILMIHGKGGSKAEQDNCAVLKAYVNLWLREMEMVQAFHSAQPRHGGTGAVYVLLRKSEEKKQENREKFSKGRVPDDDD